MDPSTEPKRKTIQVTLSVVTGKSDYEICEHIEQTLMNSSLNNSEYALVIEETKVVDV